MKDLSNNKNKNIPTFVVYKVKTEIKLALNKYQF